MKEKKGLGFTFSIWEKVLLDCGLILQLSAILPPQTPCQSHVMVCVKRILGIFDSDGCLKLISLQLAMQVDEV